VKDIGVLYKWTASSGGKGRINRPQDDINRDRGRDEKDISGWAGRIVTIETHATTHFCLIGRE